MAADALSEFTEWLQFIRTDPRDGFSAKDVREVLTTKFTKVLLSLSQLETKAEALASYIHHHDKCRRRYNEPCSCGLAELQGTDA